jgi:hypothetical protein
MVWSHHDFERELKRQLIEIESIRKRIPKLDEIKERLDRLEQSHISLIRKLGEYFDRADELTSAGSQTSGATGFAERSDENVSESGGELDAERLDEGLLAEFHLLSSQHARLARRRLPEGAATSADDGTQTVESSPQVVLVAEAVLNVPDLNERCATCGKLLISGLLAGERVTQRGSDWHHQACVETDQDDRHSSILN